MNKFLAGLFVFTITILLGIAVMIYGWGIKPVSWGWIIGGGIAGRFLIEIISNISKGEKK